MHRIEEYVWVIQVGVSYKIISCCFFLLGAGTTATHQVLMGSGDQMFVGRKEFFFPLGEQIFYILKHWE